jgi:hypothetical protein
MRVSAHCPTPSRTEAMLSSQAEKRRGSWKIHGPPREEVFPVVMVQAC